MAIPGCVVSEGRQVREAGPVELPAAVHEGASGQLVEDDEHDRRPSGALRLLPDGSVRRRLEQRRRGGREDEEHRGHHGQEGGVGAPQGDRADLHVHDRKRGAQVRRDGQEHDGLLEPGRLGDLDGETANETAGEPEVHGPADALIDHAGDEAPCRQDDRGYEGDQAAEGDELDAADAVVREGRRIIAEHGEQRLADGEPGERDDDQEAPTRDGNESGALLANRVPAELVT